MLIYDIITNNDNNRKELKEKILKGDDA